jgi:hypothetical protein
MRTALLIAAALVVSAPLAASMSTPTFAAAKKATKKQAHADAWSADPNTAFLRALGDLGRQMSEPWPTQKTKAVRTTRAKKATRA